LNTTQTINTICQIGIVILVLVRIMIDDMDSTWNNITLYSLGLLVVAGVITQIMKSKR